MTTEYIQQAGAIAYKHSEAGPSVLLVRAKKNPAHWIFPKGHIDPGETAEIAAARELLEESGVVGIIKGPAGEECFELAGKAYRVRYFFAEYVAEQGAGEPGRSPTWCSIGEAIEMLSFPAARKMLKDNSFNSR